MSFHIQNDAVRFSANFEPGNFQNRTYPQVALQDDPSIFPSNPASNPNTPNEESEYTAIEDLEYPEYDEVHEKGKISYYCKDGKTVLSEVMYGKTLVRYYPETGITEKYECSYDEDGNLVVKLAETHKKSDKTKNNNNDGNNNVQTSKAK